MFLGKRVYHGCGQFWMIITIKWDHGTEVYESWYYRPHLRDLDGKIHPIARAEAIKRFSDG